MPSELAASVSTDPWEQRWGVHTGGAGVWEEPAASPIWWLCPPAAPPAPPACPPLWCQEGLSGEGGGGGMPDVSATLGGLVCVNCFSSTVWSAGLGG